MQNATDIEVNYKVESVFNTAPGVSGGTRTRLIPCPGAKYMRQPIVSQEISSDGLQRMGRLGMHNVTMGYQQELSCGTPNDWLEALMRGTWNTPAAITQTSLTSVTTGANSIIASAGSWLTQLARIFDVVRATGLPDAANNSKNLRVTGVTASTLSTAETLVINAAPDNAFSIALPKKLVNAALPTHRSFYIEEHYRTLDLSIVIGGARIVGCKITVRPNAIALIEWTILAASVTPLATGSSPYYTSPTPTVSIPLTGIESVIRAGGSDIATLTGYELELALSAKPVEVIGSATAPDIADNQLSVKGSLSGVAADLSNVSRIQNETEISMHSMFTEPEAEPKDYFSIGLPRVKVNEWSKAFGGDDALIESMPFITGKQESVSGYDDTIAHFASSV